MEKFAILETFQEMKPAGFGHVFSFTIGNGDSYPEDYVDEEKTNAIDDEVHATLIPYLEILAKKKEMVYRDVDLLWCFKKKLLNYVCFIEPRYRIFKTLLSRYHFKTLYLEDLKEDPDYPNLSFILNRSPLKQTIHIEKINSQKAFSQEAVNGKWKPQRSILKRFCERFAKGNIRNAKIALFADPFKSENIRTALSTVDLVLYSDILSPRLIGQSFYKNFSVYQADFSKSSREHYLEQSKPFITLLDQKNIFQGFSVSDLRWDDLLQRNLRTHFERQLPKLLFDIDTLHMFFSKAKSLKACLLDEDVAPTKNAFCQLARHYGVVTYVESHGALGKRSSSLPLTAEKIFVWGKAQREKLIRWGCQPEKIIVSGRSLYSAYRKMDAGKIKEEVARELDLDPSKKIILIGLFIFRKYRKRIFENSRREMIRELFEVIAKYKEVQVILKAKQKCDENGAIFQQWVARNNVSHRVKVIDDYNPLKLIMASDIMIAHKTTFAIDGFAMNKPVIAFHDPVSYLGEEFRERKAFYHANSKEELEDLIDKLLWNDYFQFKDCERAQKECLNYHDESPEKIIVSHLLSSIKS